MAQIGWKLLAALALCALAADAFAARRGIRVDGFGDSWTLAEEFGTANCPGASGASLTMTRIGITFIGHHNTLYLTDTYCQNTRPGSFSGDAMPLDEAGLAALIGDNDDDNVTAARYTYIDRALFSGDEVGFQWGFYHFAHNGVTIATLYGLDGITLTNTTSIRKGGTILWQAGSDGYDGEYFCFLNGNYLGEWSGVLGDGSACLVPFQSLFRNGFE
jgi:hypothetical protein